MLTKIRMKDETKQLLLTFCDCSIGVISLWDEPSLPGGQHEGENSQDEGIEDPNNRQDVRPPQPAVPKVVDCGIAPADSLDGHVIPACWEDHAAKEHAQA